MVWYRARSAKNAHFFSNGSCSSTILWHLTNGLVLIVPRYSSFFPSAKLISASQTNQQTTPTLSKRYTGQRWVTGTTESHNLSHILLHCRVVACHKVSPALVFYNKVLAKSHHIISRKVNNANWPLAYWSVM